MQNVVGPTLVAMASKFGLGTEIQLPKNKKMSQMHTNRQETIYSDILCGAQA